MSEYIKLEDVKELIRTEWVKYMPSELDMNVSFVLGKMSGLPTIEVMEYPQVDGITPTVITPEVSEDNEPTWEQVKEYCFKRNFAIVGREIPKDYIRESGYAEVSEDAISRTDILKYAYKRDGVMCVSVDSIKLASSVIPTQNNALQHVESVESVEKPKEGEWIRTGRANIYGGIEVQCSNCGDKVMVQHLEDEWYCRHCGADMGIKGADDEYERAVEQTEHDMIYEPTYNSEDGSM